VKLLATLFTELNRLERGLVDFVEVVDEAVEAADVFVEAAVVVLVPLAPGKPGRFG
jgi:microcompartment protein CcmL/EutN